MKGLPVADLTTLGTLGTVLPALKLLWLGDRAARHPGHDGVQRLAVGLGAGALPAVTILRISSMQVGDAGASALAAALGRGALPRLEVLVLNDTGIGDAGLVALAPALRRLPALESLELPINLFGDEALAALVAPPLAGSPTGGLKKLRTLDFGGTQVTDAGCAAFAAVFESGALPVLTWTSICPRRISLMPYLCLWRYDALGSESEEYDESGSEEDEEDEEDEEEKEEEGGGGRRGQLSNPSGQQRETASLPAPRGGEGHQAPCTTAGTEKYRKPRRSSAAYKAVALSRFDDSTEEMKRCTVCCACRTACLAAGGVNSVTIGIAHNLIHNNEGRGRTPVTPPPSSVSSINL